MRRAVVDTVIPGLSAGLLALYLVLVALAYFGQRRLIYPVPQRVFTPQARGADLLRLGAVEAGPQVHALYRRSAPGSPTLVYFHGNGEDLSDQSLLVEEFAAHGVGVLAVEYPGYGLAMAEKPTEANLYAAAERALEHLHVQLGVPKEHTVLVGRSLGTGVASEMALRGRGARLVLISPFTSMVDVAKRVAPFLPVGSLLLDRYDTEAKATHVRQPVLIVHGESDTVVPTAMGRRLGSLFPNARVELVAGAGHNGIFDLPSYDLVGRIVAFARDPSIEGTNESPVVPALRTTIAER